MNGCAAISPVSDLGRPGHDDLSLGAEWQLVRVILVADQPDHPIAAHDEARDRP
jgi:hypothetical protein